MASYNNHALCQQILIDHGDQTIKADPPESLNDRSFSNDRPARSHNNDLMINLKEQSTNSPIPYFNDRVTKTS